MCFIDAYCGPLYEQLNDPLAKLGDTQVDEVLGRFGNWKDPSVRNGLLPLLLEAIDGFCRRHGQ